MENEEELKAQIDYITKQVILCRKDCEPKKNDKERGEWLAYTTVESIIKNSKNLERRAWDEQINFALGAR